MNKFNDLMLLEIAQLWINIIQSTVVAGILVWLAISTKPSDVIKRLEEIETRHAAEFGTMKQSCRSMEQWVIDLSKDFKEVKTKHPPIQSEAK